MFSIFDAFPLAATQGRSGDLSRLMWTRETIATTPCRATLTTSKAGAIATREAPSARAARSTMGASGKITMSGTLGETNCFQHGGAYSFSNFGKLITQEPRLTLLFSFPCLVGAPQVEILGVSVTQIRYVPWTLRHNAHFLSGREKMLLLLF